MVNDTNLHAALVSAATAHRWLPAPDGPGSTPRRWVPCDACDAVVSKPAHVVSAPCDACDVPCECGLRMHEHETIHGFTACSARTRDPIDDLAAWFGGRTEIARFNYGSKTGDMSLLRLVVGADETPVHVVLIRVGTWVVEVTAQGQCVTTNVTLDGESITRRTDSAGTRAAVDDAVREARDWVAFACARWAARRHFGDPSATLRCVDGPVDGVRTFALDDRRVRVAETDDLVFRVLPDPPMTVERAVAIVTSAQDSLENEGIDRGVPDLERVTDWIRGDVAAALDVRTLGVTCMECPFRQEVGSDWDEYCGHPDAPPEIGSVESGGLAAIGVWSEPPAECPLRAGPLKLTLRPPPRKK